LNYVKNKRRFFLIDLFSRRFFMSFFTRQRLVLLLAAVMAIAVHGISYAQLDLKGKAVETLTNGVMKELDKKFAEMVAKEALSAAVKANIVKNLSEMSRPIVKKFIDSATSGKLPNQAELVNSVMKDITPRVQELVKVALTDGGNLDTKAVPAGASGSVAGLSQTTANASSAVSYDDEKDFTVETIKESNSVRITKYAGKSTELMIPPRIGDRPVTEIGERAFVKKGLVLVAIPESVIFIGNMAFADNQISTVSIGANVYIANNAFDNTGYNSFSAGFYNAQGRKAGVYSNSWRMVSAQPMSAPRAGGTINSAPAANSQPSAAVKPSVAAQPVSIIQPEVVLPLPVPANMVKINGGTFMMGSPANEIGHDKNETQHNITVSDFYIGNFPVTQKEYKEAMGTNPSRFIADNHPVDCVNWFDAIEYCNKRSKMEGLTPAYTRNGNNVSWNKKANGYRLPTEAEWEYACRAGTTTVYNTGDIITDNTGWYDANSNDKTHSSGQKPANAWSLYDMHGNVGEWCWDWFEENYYSNSPINNPAGPSSGKNRVMRGGGWDSNDIQVRSARRYSSIPRGQVSSFGFRVVRN
jgi:formylglycine-generating enzyme required for sulfatase activity